MLQLSHKNLDVYKISMKLVEEIYRKTEDFPAAERYVLTNQLRRAAISVCSNIAEGCARKSKLEKVRFFEISRSSLVEIDTQIEISFILEYLQKNKIKELETYLERSFMMLSKMIETTRA